jgi:hypothetical protein
MSARAAGQPEHTQYLRTCQRDPVATLQDRSRRVSTQAYFNHHTATGSGGGGGGGGGGTERSTSGYCAAAPGSAARSGRAYNRPELKETLLNLPSARRQVLGAEMRRDGGGDGGSGSSNTHPQHTS